MRYQLTAISNQPVPSQRPKGLQSRLTPSCIHLQKRAEHEASDGNVKGVPAVILADAAPILGRCHCRCPVSNVSVRLFPGGSGAGLCVILVVLVEVAVLHHAEAGGGAQVLAAALVLLDGLVERPQLAQQGHVLLTQPHLEKAA